MQKSSKKHCCELTETNFEWKQQLPPNTNVLKRFLIHIGSYRLVYEKHPDCRIYFRTRSSINEEKKRQINGKYFYMIHPLSIFNVAKDIAYFSIWLISIMKLPYSLAFEPFGTSTWDQFIDIFFCIMIIINAFTGYTISSSKEIILDQKKCILRYLKTYFLIDVAFSLPTSFVARDRFSSLTLMYIALFDLFLYARFFYHKKTYFFLMNKLLNINESFCSTLGYICVMIAILHFLSGIVYYIPLMIFYHQNKVHKNSWIFTANLTSSDKTSIEKYIECFYMVTAHFFGTGSGSYDLKDLEYEQMVFCAIMFFGKIYILYISANILLLLGVASESRVKYEEIRNDLENLCENSQLSTQLKRRIERFYEYKFQRRYFDEHLFLESLSEPLQEELLLSSAKILINKNQLLRSLSKVTLGEVLALMEQEIYMPGDKIFSLGEKVEYFYFISFGTVVIYDIDGVELMHLNDGDEFSLEAVLRNKNIHSLTAEALDTSEIYKISMRHFRVHLLVIPGAKQIMEERFLKRNSQIPKTSVLRRGDDDDEVKSDEFLGILQKGKVLERPKKRIKIEHFQV